MPAKFDCAMSVKSQRARKGRVFGEFKAFWKLASSRADSRNHLRYHPCCQSWSTRFSSHQLHEHSRTVGWSEVIAGLHKSGLSLERYLELHMTEHCWGLPIRVNTGCTRHPERPPESSPVDTLTTQCSGRPTAHISRVVSSGDDQAGPEPSDIATRVHYVEPPLPAPHTGELTQGETRTVGIQTEELLEPLQDRQTKRCLDQTHLYDYLTTNGTQEGMREPILAEYSAMRNLFSQLLLQQKAFSARFEVLEDGVRDIQHKLNLLSTDVTYSAEHEQERVWVAAQHTELEKELHLLKVSGYFFASSLAESLKKGWRWSRDGESTRHQSQRHEQQRKARAECLVRLKAYGISEVWDHARATEEALFVQGRA